PQRRHRGPDVRRDERLFAATPPLPPLRELLSRHVQQTVGPEGLEVVEQLRVQQLLETGKAARRDEVRRERVGLLVGELELGDELGRHQRGAGALGGIQRGWRWRHRRTSRRRGPRCQRRRGPGGRRRGGPRRRSFCGRRRRLRRSRRHPSLWWCRRRVPGLFARRERPQPRRGVARAAVVGVVHGQAAVAITSDQQRVAAVVGVTREVAQRLQAPQYVHVALPRREVRRCAAVGVAGRDVRAELGREAPQSFQPAVPRGHVDGRLARRVAGRLDARAELDQRFEGGTIADPGRAVDSAPAVVVDGVYVGPARDEAPQTGDLPVHGCPMYRAPAELVLCVDIALLCQGFYLFDVAVARRGDERVCCGHLHPVKKNAPGRMVGITPPSMRFDGQPPHPQKTKS
ncbi:unnamed protein product, partial [Pelagomonas calceolata]